MELSIGGLGVRSKNIMIIDNRGWEIYMIYGGGGCAVTLNYVGIGEKSPTVIVGVQHTSRPSSTPFPATATSTGTMMIQ